MLANVQPLNGRARRNAAVITAREVLISTSGLEEYGVAWLSSVTRIANGHRWERR